MFSYCVSSTIPHIYLIFFLLLHETGHHAFIPCSILAMLFVVAPHDRRTFYMFILLYTGVTTARRGASCRIAARWVEMRVWWRRCASLCLRFSQQIFFWYWRLYWLHGYWIDSDAARICWTFIQVSRRSMMRRDATINAAYKWLSFLNPWQLAGMHCDGIMNAAYDHVYLFNVTRRVYDAMQQNYIAILNHTANMVMIRWTVLKLYYMIYKCNSRLASHRVALCRKGKRGLRVQL